MRQSLCAAAWIAVSLAGASYAQAQQREISGRVTASVSGQPIADASVGVVGLPVGARTNERGEYRLRIPSNDVTLMTRMIGYKRATHRLLSSETTVDFQLEKDVLQLEGVTITGAGTSIERQNATSAVSQVNAEQLNRVPAVSVENALQGKVLGASINMNNGAPGGGGQIQIRGASSLLGRIDPLIVLDGVIISNDTRSNSQRYITSSLNAGEENGTNRLSDINAADIESVEMLKGSVASAIYGSQATNGVVVIKTKRGRSGSPRFNVTQRVGMYSLLRNLGSRHFRNLDEVLAVPTVNGNEGAAAATANCTASSCPYYDYVGQLYGRRDPTLETNMSMGGGLENTKYFVSVNDRQEAGTAINTNSRHQSLRTNVDQTILGRITVGLGGNLLRTFNQRGISNNDNAQSSPLYAFAYTPAVIDLRQRDAQARYVFNPFGYGALSTSNPFQTFDLLRNNEDVYRMIGNANVNYAAWSNPNNDLRFTLLVGIDKVQNENYQFAPATLQFQQPGTAQGTYPGTSIQGNGDNLLTNSQFGGVWQFTPGSRFLSATTSAGVQYENRRNIDYTLIGQGLIPTVTTPTGMSHTVTLASQTATVTEAYYVQEEILTLNEKLLLSAAMRGERASVNGERNKVYMFPRFGASYRFLDLPGITELKLRATVGQAGNQPRYGERDLTFANGGQIGGEISLVQPSTVGNPAIKPERLTETEAGFDMSLFGDRAHFEATYFNRLITDLLVRPLLAPSTGISQTVVNGGRMRTAGSEIGLTLVPVERSRLTWTSRTSYQQNTSRIVSFPPGVLPFRLGAEGGFGTAYGRLFFSPGQKTTAIYGNAVRADGTVARDTVLGDANPKFTMSFSNDVTWGNFSLGTLVDWRHGGTVSSLTLNLYDEGNNTWDYMDPSPDQSIGATLGEYRYNKWANGNNTSVYLLDGSFVKVREITLSYDVPRTNLSALRRFGVNTTRVSLSGRNLLMFTPFNGYDPEVNNGGNQVARFVDLSPFPPSRSFFLSVDLGF